MANIPVLLDEHVTLEVECHDRLYLNGYIGKHATGGGLVAFMRGQLEKPIPSPVVLGQVSERFRDAVKVQAERDHIPIYQFNLKTALAGGISESTSASEDFSTQELTERSAENQLPPLLVCQLLRSHLDS